MSKIAKRNRSPRGVTDRSATTDVVTQLVCAAKNPHAAAMGAVIGGLVPWFGRTLAHEEIPSAWSAGQHGLAIAMIAVVLGCACFSAISVYKFGRAAFGDSRKALGFVLALEGVMLVSRGVTGAIALTILIAINAIANGSVIALSRDATRRRCEADARRAATRARSRVRRAPEPGRSVERPAARTDRNSRPARPGLVITPTWYQDVIDAEIVSEQMS
jgi:hypothetical protein